VEGAFPAAVARLKAAVGAEHVLTGEADVARYSRDTVPWQRTCSAVVFPGSTEDVRKVVQVAREYRLPVWPFSKGKNWGYGGPMACHDGAVTLILERMNRIIHVDPELAYAEVEPGVTQGQLNAYLKEHGLKLWADCTDSSPHGSVLGNALERGVGYTPYGDHFGHLCGLEVVLPTGDVVRTGGGPENLVTWHTYKYGTGPYLEGLFSQSNLGIVTRAGVWLMPEPEAFNCYFFDLRDARDFPAVIDAVRRLALARAVHSNVHIVNDYTFFTLMTRFPAELARGRSNLSEEAKAALRQRFHVAPWTVTGGLYGSAAQVRANRTLIKKELSPYGRLTFFDDAKIRKVQALVALLKKTQCTPVLGPLVRRLKDWLVSPAPAEVLEVVPRVYPIFKGVPSEFILRAAYFKNRRPCPEGDVDEARDGCGFLTFAPAAPLTGKHLQELLGLCEPVLRKHGFDLCTSFILVNPRTVVTVLSIHYDRADPDETARAGAVYDELTEVTVKAGYQQYRTSMAHMDRILDCAPGVRRLLETIKSAVDPDNILAPGRYGVGTPPASPDRP
jgi:4-cresol dehydrogenase (hydroxylating)